MVCMQHDSLKHLFKLLYRYQWRIWAGLIVVVFGMGLIFQQSAFFRFPQFQVTEPATPESVLELPSEKQNPVLKPDENLLELGEPTVPELPTAPSPVPVPSLPAISGPEEEKEIIAADVLPSSTVQDSVYRVQKGDSLWKLAEQWFGDGYQYVQIARANNLPQTAYLEIGQELRRPSRPTVGATAWQTDEPLSLEQVQNIEMQKKNGVLPQPGSNADASLSSSKTYTIQSGDSLWKIAIKHFKNGQRWTEIYDLNKERIGANPDLIYPRHQILLPDAPAAPGLVK